jgi:transposase
MRHARSRGGGELTQRDLVRLRQALLEAQDARVFKRALALMLLAEGRTWEEASRLSTLGRATISFWLGRYLHTRKLAALYDRPHTGRPPKEPVPAGLLARLLRRDPYRLGYPTHTWTVPLLCVHLRQEHGLAVTERTLRRRLHQLSYRWKRPRYVYGHKAKYLPQKKQRSSADSTPFASAIPRW